MQLSSNCLVITIIVVLKISVSARCFTCKDYLCDHAQSSSSEESHNLNSDISVESADDEMQDKLIGGGRYIKMKRNRQCPQNFIGLKPHPLNRKLYYICQESSVILAKCDGSKFSKIYKHCVTTKNQTKPPDSDPTACYMSGTFPDPSDKQYYYTCVFYKNDFIKKKLKCPDHKMFSVDEKKCREISGEISTGGNCSSEGNSNNYQCSVECSPVECIANRNWDPKPPHDVFEIIRKKKNEWDKNVRSRSSIGRKPQRNCHCPNYGKPRNKDQKSDDSDMYRRDDELSDEHSNKHNNVESAKNFKQNNGDTHCDEQKTFSDKSDMGKGVVGGIRPVQDKESKIDSIEKAEFTTENEKNNDSSKSMTAIPDNTGDFVRQNPDNDNKTVKKTVINENCENKDDNKRGDGQIKSNPKEIQSENTLHENQTTADYIDDNGPSKNQTYPDDAPKFISNGDNHHNKDAIIDMTNVPNVQVIKNEGTYLLVTEQETNNDRETEETEKTKEFEYEINVSSIENRSDMDRHNKDQSSTNDDSIDNTTNKPDMAEQDFQANTSKERNNGDANKNKDEDSGERTKMIPNEDYTSTPDDVEVNNEKGNITTSFEDRFDNYGAHNYNNTEKEIVINWEPTGIGSISNTSNDNGISTENPDKYGKATLKPDSGGTGNGNGTINDGINSKIENNVSETQHNGSTVNTDYDNGNTGESGKITKYDDNINNTITEIISDTDSTSGNDTSPIDEKGTDNSAVYGDQTNGNDMENRNETGLNDNRATTKNINESDSNDLKPDNKTTPEYGNDTGPDDNIAAEDGNERIKDDNNFTEIPDNIYLVNNDYGSGRAREENNNVTEYDKSGSGATTNIISDTINNDSKPVNNITPNDDKNDNTTDGNWEPMGIVSTSNTTNSEAKENDDQNNGVSPNNPNPDNNTTLFGGNKIGSKDSGATGNGNKKINDDQTNGSDMENRTETDLNENLSSAAKVFDDKTANIEDERLKVILLNEDGRATTKSINENDANEPKPDNKTTPKYGNTTEDGNGTDLFIDQSPTTSSYSDLKPDNNKTPIDDENDNMTDGNREPTDIEAKENDDQTNGVSTENSDKHSNTIIIDLNTPKLDNNITPFGGNKIGSSDSGGSGNGNGTINEGINSKIGDNGTETQHNGSTNIMVRNEIGLNEDQTPAFTAGETNNFVEFDDVSNGTMAENENDTGTNLTINHSIASNRNDPKSHNQTTPNDDENDNTKFRYIDDEINSNSNDNATTPTDVIKEAGNDTLATSEDSTATENKTRETDNYNENETGTDLTIDQSLASNLNDSKFHNNNNVATNQINPNVFKPDTIATPISGIEFGNEASITNRTETVEATKGESNNYRSIDNQIIETTTPGPTTSSRNENVLDTFKADDDDVGEISRTTTIETPNTQIVNDDYKTSEFNTVSEDNKGSEGTPDNSKIETVDVSEERDSFSADNDYKTDHAEAIISNKNETKTDTDTTNGEVDSDGITTTTIWTNHDREIEDDSNKERNKETDQGIGNPVTKDVSEEKIDKEVEPNVAILHLTVPPHGNDIVSENNIKSSGGDKEVEIDRTIETSYGTNEMIEDRTDNVTNLNQTKPNISKPNNNNTTNGKVETSNDANRSTGDENEAAEVTKEETNNSIGVDNQLIETTTIGPTTSSWNENELVAFKDDDGDVDVLSKTTSYELSYTPDGRTKEADNIDQADIETNNGRYMDGTVSEDNKSFKGEQDNSKFETDDVPRTNEEQDSLSADDNDKSYKTDDSVAIISNKNETKNYADTTDADDTGGITDSTTIGAEGNNDEESKETNQYIGNLGTNDGSEGQIDKEGETDAAIQTAPHHENDTDSDNNDEITEIRTDKGTGNAEMTDNEDNGSDTENRTQSTLNVDTPTTPKDIDDNATNTKQTNQNVSRPNNTTTSNGKVEIGNDANNSKGDKPEATEVTKDETNNSISIDNQTIETTTGGPTTSSWNENELVTFKDDDGDVGEISKTTTSNETPNTPTVNETNDYLNGPIDGSYIGAVSEDNNSSEDERDNSKTETVEVSGTNEQRDSFSGDNDDKIDHAEATISNKNETKNDTESTEADVDTDGITDSTTIGTEGNKDEESKETNQDIGNPGTNDGSEGQIDKDSETDVAIQTAPYHGNDTDSDNNDETTELRIDNETSNTETADNEDNDSESTLNVDQTTTPNDIDGNNANSSTDDEKETSEMTKTDTNNPRSIDNQTNDTATDNMSETSINEEMGNSNNDDYDNAIKKAAIDTGPTTSSMIEDEVIRLSDEKTNTNENKTNDTSSVANDMGNNTAETDEDQDEEVNSIGTKNEPEAKETEREIDYIGTNQTRTDKEAEGIIGKKDESVKDTDTTEADVDTTGITDSPTNGDSNTDNIFDEDRKNEDDEGSERPKAIEIETNQDRKIEDHNNEETNKEAGQDIEIGNTGTKVDSEEEIDTGYEIGDTRTDNHNNNDEDQNNEANNIAEADEERVTKDPTADYIEAGNTGPDIDIVASTDSISGDDSNAGNNSEDDREIEDTPQTEPNQNNNDPLSSSLSNTDKRGQRERETDDGTGDDDTEGQDGERESGMDIQSDQNNGNDTVIRANKDDKDSQEGKAVGRKSGSVVEIEEDILHENEEKTNQTNGAGTTLNHNSFTDNNSNDRDEDIGSAPNQDEETDSITDKQLEGRTETDTTTTQTVDPNNEIVTVPHVGIESDKDEEDEAKDGNQRGIETGISGTNIDLIGKTVWDKESTTDDDSRDNTSKEDKEIDINKTTETGAEMSEKFGTGQGRKKEQDPEADYTGTIGTPNDKEIGDSGMGKDRNRANEDSGPETDEKQKADESMIRDYSPTDRKFNETEVGTEEFGTDQELDEKAGRNNETNKKNNDRTSTGNTGKEGDIDGFIKTGPRNETDTISDKNGVATTSNESGGDREDKETEDNANASNETETTRKANSFTDDNPNDRRTTAEDINDEGIGTDSFGTNVDTANKSESTTDDDSREDRNNEGNEAFKEGKEIEINKTPEIEAGADENLGTNEGRKAEPDTEANYPETTAKPSDKEYGDRKIGMEAGKDDSDNESKRPTEIEEARTDENVGPDQERDDESDNTEETNEKTKDQTNEDIDTSNTGKEGGTEVTIQNGPKNETDTISDKNGAATTGNKSDRGQENDEYKKSIENKTGVLPEGQANNKRDQSRGRIQVQVLPKIIPVLQKPILKINVVGPRVGRPESRVENMGTDQDKRAETEKELATEEYTNGDIGTETTGIPVSTADADYPADNKLDENTDFETRRTTETGIHQNLRTDQERGEKDGNNDEVNKQTKDRTNEESETSNTGKEGETDVTIQNGPKNETYTDSDKNGVSTIDNESDGEREDDESKASSEVNENKRNKGQSNTRSDQSRGRSQVQLLPKRIPVLQKPILKINVGTRIGRPNNRNQIVSNNNGASNSGIESDDDRGNEDSEKDKEIDRKTETEATLNGGNWTETTGKPATTDDDSPTANKFDEARIDEDVGSDQERREEGDSIAETNEKTKDETNETINTSNTGNKNDTNVATQPGQENKTEVPPKGQTNNRRDQPRGRIKVQILPKRIPVLHIKSNDDQHNADNNDSERNKKIGRTTETETGKDEYIGDDIGNEQDKAADKKHETEENTNEDHGAEITGKTDSSTDEDYPTGKPETGAGIDQSFNKEERETDTVSDKNGKESDGNQEKEEDKMFAEDKDAEVYRKTGATNRTDEANAVEPEQNSDIDSTKLNETVGAPSIGQTDNRRDQTRGRIRVQVLPKRIPGLQKPILKINASVDRPNNRNKIVSGNNVADIQSDGDQQNRDNNDSERDKKIQRNTEYNLADIDPGQDKGVDTEKKLESDETFNEDIGVETMGKTDSPTDEDTPVDNKFDEDRDFENKRKTETKAGTDTDFGIVQEQNDPTEAGSDTTTTGNKSAESREDKKNKGSDESNNSDIDDSGQINRTIETPPKGQTNNRRDRIQVQILPKRIPVLQKPILNIRVDARVNSPNNRNKPASGNNGTSNSGIAPDGDHRENEDNNDSEKDRDVDSKTEIEANKKLETEENTNEGNQSESTVETDKFVDNRENGGDERSGKDTGISDGIDYRTDKDIADDNTAKQGETISTGPENNTDIVSDTTSNRVPSTSNPSLAIEDSKLNTNMEIKPKQQTSNSRDQIRTRIQVQALPKRSPIMPNLYFK